MEKLWYIDREISSTYLREEVSAGRMNAVAKMLGHPYRILGTVEHGRKLGKTRYPDDECTNQRRETASAEWSICSTGSYKRIWYSGIANIGRKPTVEQNGAVLAEIHLFDFSGDAYGSRLRLICMISADQRRNSILLKN